MYSQEWLFVNFALYLVVVVAVVVYFFLGARCTCCPVLSPVTDRCEVADQPRAVATDAPGSGSIL